MCAGVCLYECVYVCLITTIYTQILYLHSDVTSNVDVLVPRDFRSLYLRQLASVLLHLAYKHALADYCHWTRDTVMTINGMEGHSETIAELPDVEGEKDE